MSPLVSGTYVNRKKALLDEGLIVSDQLQFDDPWWSSPGYYFVYSGLPHMPNVQVAKLSTTGHVDLLIDGEMTSFRPIFDAINKAVYSCPMEMMRTASGLINRY